MASYPIRLGNTNGDSVAVDTTIQATLNLDACIIYNNLTTLEILPSSKIYGGGGNGGNGGTGGGKGGNGVNGRHGLFLSSNDVNIEHLRIYGEIIGGGGGGGGGGGNKDDYDNPRNGVGGASGSPGVGGNGGRGGQPGEGGFGQPKPTAAGGTGGTNAPGNPGNIGVSGDESQYAIGRSGGGGGGGGGGGSGQSGGEGGAGGGGYRTGSKGGNGGAGGYSIYQTLSNIAGIALNRGRIRSMYNLANITFNGIAPSKYFLCINDDLNKIGKITGDFRFLDFTSAKMIFGIDPQSKIYFNFLNETKSYANVIQKNLITGPTSGTCVVNSFFSCDWQLIPSTDVNYYNLNITYRGYIDAPIYLNLVASPLYNVPSEYIANNLNQPAFILQSDADIFINNYKICGGGGSGGIGTEFNGVGTAGKSGLFITPTNTINTLINKGVMIGGGGGGGGGVQGGTKTNGVSGTNSGYGGQGGNYKNGNMNIPVGGLGGSPGVVGSIGNQYTSSATAGSIAGTTYTSGAGGGGSGAKGGVGVANGGNGGYGIENAGNIVNLYNSQGGIQFPLYIKGELPINYYMIINDNNENYGQLWGDANGSINNFYIDIDGSIINNDVTTYEKTIKKSFINIIPNTTYYYYKKYKLLFSDVIGDYYDISYYKKENDSLVDDNIVIAYNILASAGQNALHVNQNITRLINKKTIIGGGGNGGVGGTAGNFDVSIPGSPGGNGGTGGNGSDALVIDFNYEINYFKNEGLLLGGGGGGGGGGGAGLWLLLAGRPTAGISGQRGTNSNGGSGGLAGTGGSAVVGPGGKGAINGLPGSPPGGNRGGKGGDGGYGILNNGTITNFYNSQGGNQLSLYIKGNVPSNYYITINDELGNYGQLWGDASGITNFNVDYDNSIFNIGLIKDDSQTYPKVIKKSFVSSTNPPLITIPGNEKYNALLQDNTTDPLYYDLKIIRNNASSLIDFDNTTCTYKSYPIDYGNLILIETNGNLIFKSKFKVSNIGAYCIGGGGAGGRCANSHNAGGGGGAGNVGGSSSVDCQNIVSLNFAIGAGGSGVNANGNGKNGEDSKIIITHPNGSLNYTAQGGGGGGEGQKNGSNGGCGGGTGSYKSGGGPNPGNGQMIDIAGAKYGFNGGKGRISGNNNAAGGGGGGPAGLGGSANDDYSLGGLGMKILGSSDFSGAPIIYHSGGGAGGGSNGYYGLLGVGSFGSGNGGIRPNSTGYPALNTYIDGNTSYPCFGGGGGGAGNNADGIAGGNGAKGVAYLFITKGMITEV